MTVTHFKSVSEIWNKYYMYPNKQYKRHFKFTKNIQKLEGNTEFHENEEIASTKLYLCRCHNALMMYHLSVPWNYHLVKSVYKSWKFHFLVHHSSNTSITASYSQNTTMCFNRLMIIISRPFFTNKNRSVNCLIPTFQKLETGSNSNETVYIPWM